jgi:hypothetical protein
MMGQAARVPMGTDGPVSSLDALLERSFGGSQELGARLREVAPDTTTSPCQLSRSKSKRPPCGGRPPSRGMPKIGRYVQTMSPGPPSYDGRSKPASGSPRWNRHERGEFAPLHPTGKTAILVAFLCRFSACRGKAGGDDAGRLRRSGQHGTESTVTPPH